MLLWYNYTHGKSHLLEYLQPSVPSPEQSKHTGRLTMQRTPVFSSYRKLRRTQPDQYFTLETQRRMYQDQKDVGPAFFDLMYEVEDESV